MELEKDENGNVITRPVTGWLTSPAGGIAVVLGIQYAESPADIERGTCKHIQCILLPQQALELAESLTTQARRLLEPHPQKSTLM